MGAVGLGSFIHWKRAQACLDSLERQELSGRVWWLSGSEGTECQVSYLAGLLLKGSFLGRHGLNQRWGGSC